MVRWLLCLLLVAPGASLFATDAVSAEANFKRVEVQVKAGAVPRSALDAARLELQKARDEEILRRGLSTGTMAPQDVPEMLRAVDELQQQAADALTAQQKLVDAGVVPSTALAPFRARLSEAEHQAQLAHAHAGLLEQLEVMAQREAEMKHDEKDHLALHSAGKGAMSLDDVHTVESAFYLQFSKTLPISADGETAVHRALGFDHRDRVDVALNPDQEEGRWLLRLLDRLHIPYIAFRQAVAGRATGAHIHLGLPSPRLSTPYPSPGLPAAAP